MSFGMLRGNFILVNSNQVTGIKSGVKPTQNVIIRILLFLCKLTVNVTPKFESEDKLNRKILLC